MAASPQTTPAMNVAADQVFLRYWNLLAFLTYTAGSKFVLVPLAGIGDLLLLLEFSLWQEMAQHSSLFLSL